MSSAQNKALQAYNIFIIHELGYLRYDGCPFGLLERLHGGVEMTAIAHAHKYTKK